MRLEPAQQDVTLIGRPGSDQSLSTRLSLYSSQAIPELLFRPGDLLRQDGKEKIPRVQIQVMSAESLKNIPEHTPREFDLKVTGLRVPGVYSGDMDFVLPRHGVTSALRVHFVLTVQETPKLTLRKGSESLKIQLTNCSWVWCQLAKRINPDTVRQDFTVPLDNGSVLPIDATEVAASATGDVHHRNTGAAIDLSKVEKTIPVQPIISIPFEIAADDLVPDHYVGDIQLRMPGKDEALKIPLELNVRDAPALPLLVLAVGILIGILIKYMKEKGTPQADLLRQYLQIQARAEQNPADAGLLKHLLDLARWDIDAFKLDAAKAELTVIENRLTLLTRLRDLESLLLPRNDDAAVKEILRDIFQVRYQISAGTDPTNTASAIEQAVSKLFAPAGTETQTVEMSAAASIFRAAPFAVKDGALLPRGVGPVRRFIAAVGHRDALRADFTLWFLRPLVWAVSVILLIGTGFIQLYLKNPIFGADGVGDYLGLLIWATGADVAGRALSSARS